ncbi:MAG: amino acid ABC transporter permease [Clostridiales bacterium]|jgi:polar amino acid transport system permease protein|nr:amino acid ABC transporter permease [Clostridiales bacterium]
MTQFFKTAYLLTDGIKYTLIIFFVTIILSMPLGFLLTLARNSKIKVIRYLTATYVWIMRGSPLMLQLFFFLYGLTFIPVINKFLVMDRLTAALVAFVLNYAAYFCGIFRGGLLAVDPGQYEAAKVLGLGKIRTFVKIVMPQMIRVALPAISNECITLVKDTALVTAIGLTELMYFAKTAANNQVSALPYLVAAVFYLLMNLVLERLFAYLEKKYSFTKNTVPAQERPKLFGGRQKV